MNIGTSEIKYPKTRLALLARGPWILVRAITTAFAIMMLGTISSVGQQNPPTWTGFNAVDYGIASNGGADAGAKLNALITKAQESGGGIVFLPPGTYLTDHKISIPDNVWLEGSGANNTRIIASKSFNDTSVVTNTDQNGRQEYLYLSGLTITARPGAVVTDALMNITSVFVNSFVRDVIISNSPSTGLHIKNTVGLGPLLLENIWVLHSTLDNVLVDEPKGGPTNQMANIIFRNLTSEHQASGYAAVRLKGYGHLTGIDFDSLHIEMVNTGVGTTGLTIDGAHNISGRKIQISAGAASPLIGIHITTAFDNAYIQLSDMTNINGISPFLVDDFNNFTFTAATSGAFRSNYWTPDYGITPTKVAKLEYSPNLRIDASAGDFISIEVTDRKPFTIANPINLRLGQLLTLEIVNLSGGEIGAATWGSAWVFHDSSRIRPTDGHRRTVQFRCYEISNGIHRLVQVGAASDDM